MMHGQQNVKHIGDVTPKEYFRTVYYDITCAGAVGGINSTTADRYLQETTKKPSQIYVLSTTFVKPVYFTGAHLLTPALKLKQITSFPFTWAELSFEMCSWPRGAECNPDFLSWQIKRTRCCYRKQLISFLAKRDSLFKSTTCTGDEDPDLGTAYLDISKIGNYIVTVIDLNALRYYYYYCCCCCCCMYLCNVC